jgi:hypothetical protein
MVLPSHSDTATGKPSRDNLCSISLTIFIA